MKKVFNKSCLTTSKIPGILEKISIKRPFLSFFQILE